MLRRNLHRRQLSTKARKGAATLKDDEKAAFSSQFFRDLFAQKVFGFFPATKLTSPRVSSSIPSTHQNTSKKKTKSQEEAEGHQKRSLGESFFHSLILPPIYEETLMQYLPSPPLSMPTTANVDGDQHNTKNKNKKNRNQSGHVNDVVLDQKKKFIRRLVSDYYEENVPKVMQKALHAVATLQEEWSEFQIFRRIFWRNSNISDFALAEYDDETLLAKAKSVLYPRKKGDLGSESPSLSQHPSSQDKFSVYPIHASREHDNEVLRVLFKSDNVAFPFFPDWQDEISESNWIQSALYIRPHQTSSSSSWNADAKPFSYFGQFFAKYSVLMPFCWFSLPRRAELLLVLYNRLCECYSAAAQGDNSKLDHREEPHCVHQLVSEAPLHSLASIHQLMGTHHEECGDDDHDNVSFFFSSSSAANPKSDMDLAVDIVRKFYGIADDEEKMMGKASSKKALTKTEQKLLDDDISSSLVSSFLLPESRNSFLNSYSPQQLSVALRCQDPLVAQFQQDGLLFLRPSLSSIHILNELKKSSHEKLLRLLIDDARRRGGERDLLATQAGCILSKKLLTAHIIALDLQGGALIYDDYTPEEEGGKADERHDNHDKHYLHRHYPKFIQNMFLSKKEQKKRTTAFLGYTLWKQLLLGKEEAAAGLPISSPTAAQFLQKLLYGHPGFHDTVKKFAKVEQENNSKTASHVGGGEAGKKFSPQIEALLEEAMKNIAEHSLATTPKEKDHQKEGKDGKIKSSFFCAAQLMQVNAYPKLLRQIRRDVIHYARTIPTVRKDVKNAASLSSTLTNLVRHHWRQDVLKSFAPFISPQQKTVLLAMVHAIDATKDGVVQAVLEQPKVEQHQAFIAAMPVVEEKPIVASVPKPVPQAPLEPKKTIVASVPKPVAQAPLEPKKATVVEPQKQIPSVPAKIEPAKVVTSPAVKTPTATTVVKPSTVSQKVQVPSPVEVSFPAVTESDYDPDLSASDLLTAHVSQDLLAAHVSNFHLAQELEADLQEAMRADELTSLYAHQENAVEPSEHRNEKMMSKSSTTVETPVTQQHVLNDDEFVEKVLGMSKEQVLNVAQLIMDAEHDIVTQISEAEHRTTQKQLPRGERKAFESLVKEEEKGKKSAGLQTHEEKMRQFFEEIAQGAEGESSDKLPPRDED